MSLDHQPKEIGNCACAPKRSRLVFQLSLAVRQGVESHRIIMSSGDYSAQSGMKQRIPWHSHLANASRVCVVGRIAVRPTRRSVQFISSHPTNGSGDASSWCCHSLLGHHKMSGDTDARTVTLQTTQGAITFELYWSEAPKTCENFFQLAQRGYYNGTPFHRIIDGFMIQGGDPTGTGRGGSSIYGERFSDEFHPTLRFTGAGILASANSGPNTNGSQFFITLAPTPHLDGKHTIFGRVLSGMKIVQRIGLVAVDANDRPKEDVRILKGDVA